MIPLKKIVDLLMVFIFLHMSSGASVIALSDIALVFFTTATIAVAYVRRVSIDRYFFYFSCGYVCLSFFYMMQMGWLNYSATARLYVKILYAYLLIKCIGGSFFKHLETNLIALATISLPLFMIQLQFPHAMMEANGFLEAIIPQVPKGEGVDYSNSFLFTVNPWALTRNSGFMWEPGAFAAVLSIGIFLRILRKKSQLDWAILVMVLALISTFSTTGYGLLVLLSLFFLINQDARMRFYTLPVMIVGIGLLIQFSPAWDKVTERYENRSTTIENQENYYGKADGISVGRFGSLLLDWEDFSKYPIIGHGLQENERTTGKYIHFVRANGLSDYMARFGALGVIFLLFNLFKTFKVIHPWSGARWRWMGIPIVALLAFSNPLLTAPLFIALQIYHISANPLTTHEIATPDYHHTYA